VAPRFRDRNEAGRALADRLAQYGGRDDVVVLALPRGGVPVGAEVAAALGAPLDVFVVRKLGVPGHEELAMGAVATGGVRVVNEEVVAAARVDRDRLEAVTAAERIELERREAAYRGNRPAQPVRGRTVLLVDDGLATGASMRAAATAVRQLEPAKIVIAVPVAPLDTCRDLATVADEVVCVLSPTPFLAVGNGYRDFHQVTDSEVTALLAPGPGDAALRP
jgi:predicted phosphoribosyltransferase